MIRPRLFPREARGATSVANRVALDVSRWAQTRAPDTVQALREPREKRAQQHELPARSLAND